MPTMRRQLGSVWFLHSLMWILLKDCGERRKTIPALGRWLLADCFRLRSLPPKAGKQTVSMSAELHWITLQRTLKVWFKTERPENCACVPLQRVLWEDVLINRFTVSLFRNVKLDALCFFFFFFYLHRYLEEPSDGVILYIISIRCQSEGFYSSSDEDE